MDLIPDSRMRTEFERYYKAKSSAERQAIAEEHNQWFNSLTEEERKVEVARQMESIYAVLEGVRINNEELDAKRIREKLGNVPEAISMSYIAKNYFGKTKTWLYQRLNGNKVNGKEARFTESEARQLQNALHDLGQRLSSIVLL